MVEHAGLGKLVEPVSEKEINPQWPKQCKKAKNVEFQLEAPIGGSMDGKFQDDGSTSTIVLGNKKSLGLFEQAFHDTGESDLHRHVRHGNLEAVMEILSQHRTQPDVVDYLGETPLFEASASGNVDMVAALLCYRADANIKSHSGSVCKSCVQDHHIRNLLRIFDDAVVSQKDWRGILDRIEHDAVRGLLVNMCAVRQQGVFRRASGSASGMHVKSAIARIQTRRR